MMMKRLNNLLDDIEELEGLLPKSGGRTIGISPSTLISQIRNHQSVAQLTFLARNSPKAVEAILDRLVSWSDKEGDDEALNFDMSVSAILIALIDANCIEAEIMASTIADDEDHYHAAIIAHTYLLEQQMKEEAE